MRTVYRPLLMVLGGIVGGYLGYWVGHVAGWSADAEWPWHVGGGTGAIVTSMVGAVLGVLLVAVLLALPALLSARHLRRAGVTTEGTVITRRDLGARMAGRHGRRQQYDLLVDVRLPDGTRRPLHTTQWLEPTDVDALLPGRAVAVRVDPRHPDRILAEAPLIHAT
jgi:MFS family permease